MNKKLNALRKLNEYTEGKENTELKRIKTKKRGDKAETKTGYSDMWHAAEVRHVRNKKDLDREIALMKVETGNIIVRYETKNENYRKALLEAALQATSK